MKPKSKSLRLRELRADLHYYQQMVRVDIRSLKAGIRKCKEIGAKMRALQNGQAVEHVNAADGCNAPRPYWEEALERKLKSGGI